MMLRDYCCDQESLSMALRGPYRILGSEPRLVMARLTCSIVAPASDYEIFGSVIEPKTAGIEPLFN